MVPQWQLDKVYKEIKAKDARLEKLEREEQERQAKTEAEKGNYEAALSTYKTKAEKAESYEAIIKNYLEIELTGLPEEAKAMVPELSIEAKLDWISKNKAMLLKIGKAQDPSTERPAVPTTTNSSPAAPITGEVKLKDLWREYMACGNAQRRKELYSQINQFKAASAAKN
jgi:hypothetical protein